MRLPVLHFPLHAHEINFRALRLMYCVCTIAALLCVYIIIRVHVQTKKKTGGGVLMLPTKGYEMAVQQNLWTISQSTAAAAAAAAAIIKSTKCNWM